MSMLAFSYQLIFFFVLLLSFHFQVNFSSSLKQLCHENESQSLLQFKDSFSHDESASINCDISYNSSDSWKLGTDCCLWDGVTCDNATGQVITLEVSCNSLKGNIPFNSSLFNLSHLKRLNLAYNDFNNSAIPSKFGSFLNLTHLNLSSAMFSGLVPPEISHLSKLVSLDLSQSRMLSFDTPTLDKIVRNLSLVEELFLDAIDISVVGIGSLANLSSSLISLTLSQSNLQGQFPESVFWLPNLQILDLTWNSDLYISFPKSNWSSPLELLFLGLTNITELPESIEGLTSLLRLNLDSCHLTGSFPASLAKLKQLVTLDLSDNNISGEIPDVFGNGNQLKNLFLSRNNFSGSLPLSFFNLAGISLLDLSKNQLQGTLPYEICDLTNLTELDLSSNLFIGTLLSCLLSLPALNTFNMNNNSLTSLTNNISHLSPLSVFSLTHLDLSANRIQGFLPQYICQFTGLLYLDLSTNSFSGDIPPCLFRLPSLRSLYMNDNQLGGELGKFESKSLFSVQMNGNKISGIIPPTVFELVNLTELLLSSNNLSGVVDLSMFSKLKNFWGLNISFNRLSVITTNGTWPQFYKLALSSSSISEFPEALKTQNQLNFLSLSHNRIHGKIPKWLSGIQFLQYLDLYHNFLTSADELPINLQYLDLSSNFFEQPLPTLPQSMYIVLLANNNFRGEISPLICNITTLQIIDLSNNNLSGTIPQCLANFSVQLSVLNLGGNSFHGTIPGPFLDGIELRNLNLNGNQLEGSLPRSLVNCKMLEVLDLGNNKLNDSFPKWLEALANLQVLVLRSNRFHGPIENPATSFPFPSLRILDLSFNELSSLLPTYYFKHLQAMMKKDEVEGKPKYMGELYYQDSVFLTVKGTGIELVRILTVYTTIDMSVNKFEGNIPDIIGNLISLRILNFSHNDLVGPISSSLGNLLQLESLDLSSNMLEGGIPEELTNLNFLQVFNVSYNRLSGLIPQGKQFNTFPNDSYVGNMELCGFPLSEKCGDDSAPRQPTTNLEDEEDSASMFNWEFSAMGYGCGIVIGISMGYVVLTTGKPEWLARLAKRLEMRMDKIKNALLF